MNPVSVLDLPAYLDRICELIQLGLDALNHHQDPKSMVARTALRLARSEIAVLKDEAQLAEAMKAYKVPDTTGRKPSKRRPAQRPK